MSIAGDILGSVVRDMVGDAMNAEAKAMKKSYEERKVGEATSEANKLAKEGGLSADEAEEEISASETGVKHIGSEIIYRILEEREEWVEARKNELEEESREIVVYPGRIILLPDHTFRVSKPAVVGVRVLAGRVHIGQGLLKDGNRVGRIKSIRSGQESLKEARQGAEVAISVDGVTVGRQIEEGDILLVDIPESHARKLRKLEMTPMEEEVYEELLSIHRKNDHFWGR